MTEKAKRTYIAIDLKSFYSSVECAERGLDPLNTNLVVADVSRTDKTICLAVSPSLKAYGIAGRARLFEVKQRINEVNYSRERQLPQHSFTGKSVYDNELKAHGDWTVDFIAAPPRMALYLKYSHRINSIYLKYVAPEDLHSYSIDEVFMDVTDYLGSYSMTAHELTRKIIRHVLDETGITATAGIGTNMYLAKVAMDIVAKHIPADKDGVRIAELDEMSYRRKLWAHKPMTDFWRFGAGTVQHLAMYGITTMGQLARYSLTHEYQLYKMFGVNAEWIIDHAWGWEPCTMKAIKEYRPKTNSLSNGQVLSCPYTAKKAMVVVKEMADAMALRLVDKRLVTDHVTLHIGYDHKSLAVPDIGKRYDGPTKCDFYGRTVPKSAHGNARLPRHTSSSRLITQAVMEIFEQKVNKDLLVHRINITAGNVIPENSVREHSAVQLDLFTDYEELYRRQQQENQALAKERTIQETMLQIKKRFGKNSILRGLNFDEGATAKERNQTIGGHKA